MKYKVINTTKIPTDDIHTAILFSAPKGLEKFIVTVDYCKDSSIWDGCAYPFRKTPMIKILFQKEKIKFPVSSANDCGKNAGYHPVFTIKDKYELLIALFAHELRHIWQEKVSTQNFTDSKLGHYTDNRGIEQVTIYKMERDACQYAKKVIERYRNL